MSGTGHALVRGSAWMLALRWSLRGLGLLNTFILARLLTPGDFGLVAMAMAVVGLVEVLGQTGQQLALIRLPDPGRDDYDSVWTLGVLVAAALTLLLWAVAPLAPLYFHAPQAVWLIRLLALRTLAGGFENVGVVAFRKELRFGREFQFQMAQRLAATGVTLGCALWLRDERALVAGILGGRVLSVALSYRLHPYRPRWCTRRIAALLGFSGWMLAVHVAQYVQDKADEIVVGGLGDPGAMGRYAVASDIATAPTVEVVLPITRALFPVFARLGGDMAAIRAAYLDVFAAACAISVATGLGMALVAEDFIRLALGPGWLAAVPLARILAIAGGLYGIMQNGIPVLNATGHARLSAWLTGSRAAATVLALAVAAWLGDAGTVALARAAVTALFIPGVFLALAAALPITPGDLLARGWRPLAAALPMTLAVRAAQTALPGLDPGPDPGLAPGLAPGLDPGLDPGLAWARLLLAIGAGGVAYLGAMLLLWRLAGRPAGPEAAGWRAMRRVAEGTAAMRRRRTT